MNYQEFIQPVQRLAFITSPERADAATKAVLGILASRIEEDTARKLTERLPEPLTLDTLRSHQERPNDTSAEDYVATVATHFSIDEDQASQLIDTVLDCARQSMGEDRTHEIQSALPADWRRLMEH